VNSSTLAPFPAPGCKRSRSASGSPSQDLGLCLSSASANGTPASSPPSASLPSQGGNDAGGEAKGDAATEVKNLYQFYCASQPSTSRARSGSEHMSSDTIDMLVDNDDEELENYLYESSRPDGAELSELDKYMADAPLRISGQFDILAWWKNQVDEYPILSQIARDLLAVQVSTVASESAFSAGGRVIDPFRSRLDPEMVEALVCTKDWVAATKRDKRVGSIVADLEVIEALAAKLTIQDDEVADSDEEAHADDLEFGLDI